MRDPEVSGLTRGSGTALISPALSSSSHVGIGPAFEDDRLPLAPIGAGFMAKKLVFALFSTIMVFGLVGFAAKEDPKYTTKEVMKEAHKGGLLKKVTSGKASEEEKEKLLELYKAMAENEPSKGSEEDWKKRTEAVVVATEDLLEGKDGAGEALGKAINCKDCHTAHKK